MEYTQDEQNIAIKTLSNLVKENQQLRDQLEKAQEFVLRMFLSQQVSFTDNSIDYYDNAIIDYSEDWEKILPYFIFNFYPNSNANVKDGIYKSSFTINVKNGTPFPKSGNIKDIKEKIEELNKQFNK